MNSYGAVFKENKIVKKKSQLLQEIKISSFIHGFDISSPSTSGLIRINFWTSNRSHLPLGKQWSCIIPYPIAIFYSRLCISVSIFVVFRQPISYNSCLPFHFLFSNCQWEQGLSFQSLPRYAHCTWQSWNIAKEQQKSEESQSLASKLTV